MPEWLEFRKFHCHLLLFIWIVKSKSHDETQFWLCGKCQGSQGQQMQFFTLMKNLEVIVGIYFSSLLSVRVNTFIVFVLKILIKSWGFALHSFLLIEKSRKGCIISTQKAKRRFFIYDSRLFCGFLFCQNIFPPFHLYLSKKILPFALSCMFRSSIPS